MLEMKAFSEVDLNSTPIVVLGCGHFFTTETLDGLVGVAEVYDMNSDGTFIGLRDFSGTLAPSVPRCPDCQRPIRQYATQRYNRVINRAMTDEISKRFLTSGKASLQELEVKVSSLRLDLKESRQELIKLLNAAGTRMNPVRSVAIVEQLKSRTTTSDKLTKAVAVFLKSVAEKHQPVRKLHDATVKAIRTRKPLSEQMEQLTMQGVSTLCPDQQVILDGRAVQLMVNSLILADRLELLRELESSLADTTTLKTSGSSPVRLASAFFKSCEDLVADCDAANLTKLNVETRLQYSGIACLYRSYMFATKSQDVNHATTYVQRAKDLLEAADKMCTSSFHNAAGLREAVEETLRLLGKEWYEPVSAEEIAAIKAAMVSGPRGIATHSGHWYKCRNGHPVGYLVRCACLAYADMEHSLRLESVGCRWRRRGVWSVGPLLGAGIMSLSQGSVVRWRWSRRFLAVAEVI